MFKLFSIVALVGFLAACSTLSETGRVSGTAAMGASGIASQNAIGPQGNGP